MKKLILVGAICVFFCAACSSSQTIEKAAGNSDHNSAAANSAVGVNENKTGAETRIAPSADTLSVALTLFRNGRSAPADASAVFVKDDGIRLNISAVEKGYLLALYRGSNGGAQIIFPNKDYFNGKNEIELNKNVEIPNKGWFFLDEKKGTETIFIVYSKRQNLDDLTSNPKQTIEAFEKIRAGSNNAEAFTTEDGHLVRVVEIKHG